MCLSSFLSDNDTDYVRGSAPPYIEPFVSNGNNLESNRSLEVSNNISGS